MPFIQNCAASDISTGQFYKDPGENSMLIQIMDPASYFPKPAKEFKEIHQFEFLDIEADDLCFNEECRCQQGQASDIVRLLHHALETDMNVIVHCMAGISRSGAVAEVGTMIGFTDTKRYRHPNLLVKHLMMRELGLPYDKDETQEPYDISAKFGWEDEVDI